MPHCDFYATPEDHQPLDAPDEVFGRLARHVDFLFVQ